MLFWTNKAKADANGLLPLYARVTVNGKRAEISLKKKVNPYKWDAKTGFLKGNGEEVRLVNKYIKEVSNELFDIYSSMAKKNEHFNAEEIKGKYIGHIAPITKTKTLLEIFDEHNRDVERLVGKDYVKATLTKYKTIQDKIFAFMKAHYGKEDLALDVLDFTFISDFEKILKITDNMKHNTAMAYIKRVKRIMNIAVNNQWVAINPFTAIKCTTRKIARNQLSEEEPSILTAKEFKVKRLNEVRDCFLFSCYTGYAFVATQKLSPEHIVKKSMHNTG